jgi:hypothetical protein
VSLLVLKAFLLHSNATALRAFYIEKLIRKSWIYSRFCHRRFENAEACTILRGTVCFRVNSAFNATSLRAFYIEKLIRKSWI